MHPFNAARSKRYVKNATKNTRREQDQSSRTTVFEPILFVQLPKIALQSGANVQSLISNACQFHLHATEPDGRAKALSKRNTAFFELVLILTLFCDI